MPVKVLVVDDHSSNRDLLTWILDDEGYDYKEADNGANAVELFVSYQPDLVLMDIMMPILDGYEATRQIKELSKDRYIPVIFLTALTDDQSLIKCLSVGGDDFFSKPFSEIILKSKIKAHLRVASLIDKIRFQNIEINHYNSRLEHEQRMAEHVFSHALKDGLECSKNIRSYISPASLFNGDVLMSAYRPSGGMYVLLGDFTGHGLPAAMGSIPLSQVFYAMTKKQLSLGMIAREINKVMCSFLPDHMFLAATIVEIDANGKQLKYWAGGMVDGYVCDQRDCLTPHRITSTHTPLGIDSDEEFDSSVKTLSLTQGDKIYLLTDGITETYNCDGEMFGEKGIEDNFNTKGLKNRLIKNNNIDVFESILKSVEIFRGEHLQDDDVSLVELTAQPIEIIQTEQIKSQQLRAQLPWSQSMKLGFQQLKNVDPVPALLDMLGELTGQYGHKEFISIILNELYTNAFEHGVLNLCSSLKLTEEGFDEYYQLRDLRQDQLTQGFIHIDLSYTPIENGGVLSISLYDSGAGFDHDYIIEKIKSQSDDEACGRGICLVNALCSRLEYSDGGRKVSAEYLLV
jgi:CheY-like chemotaxis protein/anti-sigma regulatory factor (Ser/Thr protein kinase)